MPFNNIPDYTPLHVPSGGATKAELLHTLALQKVPLVGDINAKKLISHIGSAEAVFRAKKSELVHIDGIGDIMANHIHAFAQDASQFDALERELLFLEKHDIRSSLYWEKSYPERLKHYPDCPTVLFSKGDWDANRTPRIIGIVGTRKPTQYGKMFCERLIHDLLPYNPTIVSGLAYGIDVCAHRRSLEVGLHTVGVLAHGLSLIYPSEHRSTAAQMIESGGALLTEFTSTTAPARENFPRRNRIVAGLCEALIVVETGIKGGSVITAHIALEYGKEVFALPGDITRPQSVGCNRLIKRSAAAIIESAEDLVEALGWALDADPKHRKADEPLQLGLFGDLSEDELKIMQILADRAEHHADELIRGSGLMGSQFAVVMLSLEMNGIIRGMSGQRYVAEM